MIDRPQLRALVAPFLASYDQTRMDAIWRSQSEQFRNFLQDVVFGPNVGLIADDVCDRYIAILDRNGKGNTKASQAVAKAMIPQGAWRRMLNEFQSNRPLGQTVRSILTDVDPKLRAHSIDALYALNRGAKNYLTGESGNAIGALLAAWAPTENLSIISLKDRRAIVNYLGLETDFDWDSASIGTRFAFSNGVIVEAARALGLPDNARTITAFFYSDAVKPLWREQHEVIMPGGMKQVTVPTREEEEEGEEKPGATEQADELRESMRVQAMLCRIGAAMGYRIWLPRVDRSRVLKAWTPEPGQLIETLALPFDKTTIATIEQIDVLWLDRRSAIVRAFEVEHTTAVYSGLLRMADLIALQPNLKIKLHIVAALDRREKVLREISRPVFTVLGDGAMRECCSYVSYDGVRFISDNPSLHRLTVEVLQDVEEFAEDDADH